MTRSLISLAVVSLALAGCVTTSPPRWERSGASDATNARDASDCSAISWTEAERLHPYKPTQSTGTITVDSDWLRQRQQVDNERFEDANRFFALCMQGRGYAKVEVAPR